MIAINPDTLNSKELFALVAQAKAKHSFKTIIIHQKWQRIRTRDKNCYQKEAHHLILGGNLTWQ